MKNEATRTNAAPNRQMNQLLKYFYYPIVLFGNVAINKMPSRHVRK